MPQRSHCVYPAYVFSRCPPIQTLQQAEFEENTFHDCVSQPSLDHAPRCQGVWRGAEAEPRGAAPFGRCRWRAGARLRAREAGRAPKRGAAPFGVDAARGAGARCPARISRWGSSVGAGLTTSSTLHARGCRGGPLPLAPPPRDHRGRHQQRELSRSGEDRKRPGTSESRQA